ncbi:gastrotropin-like [Siniperca chuatsi]|uniref:gastrotropin-like n=1 Tax=Siniperca chuatsi TaxID=119488 RepID=UPI001CE044FC|nr:gastrotropin-like [Siniperca chuatsi]USU43502.1 Fabp6a [Siniperca chuatsi]
MQMREVARGVQYISREQSWSQYLAFPSTCLSISALTPPPTNTTKMAFAGRWETETQEGYDEFCKLLGIPDDIIEKGRDYKLITEVTQNGDDFSWTQIYPTNAKVTNKFTVGKEADMETIGGKKFKATVYMEGGKLSVTFPNYHHTSEISGGKLVETSKAGSVLLKRTSKKI